MSKGTEQLEDPSDQGGFVDEYDIPSSPLPAIHSPLDSLSSPPSSPVNRPRKPRKGRTSSAKRGSRIARSLRSAVSSVRTGANSRSRSKNRPRHPSNSTYSPVVRGYKRRKVLTAPDVPAHQQDAHSAPNNPPGSLQEKSLPEAQDKGVELEASNGTSQTSVELSASSS